jgi:drug/metabolite transporter (DMT)-like permease
MATGQLTFGALLLLPVALLSGPPGTPRIDGILSLVAIGVFSTALAWPLYFRVMAHTTPTAASTVTFIVPAFGIAWGALALSEPVGVELLVGFALVIVSLVLVLGLRTPSLAGIGARLSRRTDRLAPRPIPL